MNVLGLHFGHDAAVAVLCDGCTASYLVRERHNRAKHALSLDLSLIRLGLQDAGIGIADVDCVAICSTQGYGIVADDPSSLAISLESHEGHGGQSTLTRRFSSNPNILKDLLEEDILRHIYADGVEPSP